MIDPWQLEEELKRRGINNFTRKETYDFCIKEKSIYISINFFKNTITILYRKKIITMFSFRDKKLFEGDYNYIQFIANLIIMLKDFWTVDTVKSYLKINKFLTKFEKEAQK
jgi:hypothetical protein